MPTFRSAAWRLMVRPPTSSTSPKGTTAKVTSTGTRLSTGARKWRRWSVPASATSSFKRNLIGSATSVFTSPKPAKPRMAARFAPMRSWMSALTFRSKNTPRPITCTTRRTMKSDFAAVMGLGVFFERKVSALIQDRIGANRAAILGFAGLGLVNTLVADPIKFLLKEDVALAGTDHLLHFLAPVLSLVPVLVTFAVVPFGDVLQVGGRTINLQAAELNVGILYVLAMVSLGVYGVVLGGWASNNRWSLLGGIRGSAQMISYEIAMGLGLIGVVLTYGTLD